jgi:hypothetical protein
MCFEVAKGECCSAAFEWALRIRSMPLVFCNYTLRRLRLRSLLGGVVRTYRTTGDEAPASVWRRGRWPRKRHMGVLTLLAPFAS